MTGGITSVLPSYWSSITGSTFRLKLMVMVNIKDNKKIFIFIFMF